MEDQENHVSLAEPAGHVKNALSEADLEAASQAGLVVADRPHMRRSHTALEKSIGVIYAKIPSNSHLIATARRRTLRKSENLLGVLSATSGG